MRDYHDADVNECACGAVPLFDNAVGDDVTPRIWRLECSLCLFVTDWCFTPWEAVEVWNSSSNEVHA